MKERIITIGTLLCLFVLTCLFLTFAIAIYPGIDAIRWFFRTSAVVIARLDAPAWVQALGSAVGICIAIAVPAVQFSREANRRAREDAGERARRIGIYVAIAERAMQALAHAEAHIRRPLGANSDWSHARPLVDEVDGEIDRMGRLSFEDLPSYSEIRTAYLLLDALRAASKEIRSLAQRKDELRLVTNAVMQPFTVLLGSVQAEYGILANQYQDERRKSGR